MPGQVIGDGVVDSLKGVLISAGGVFIVLALDTALIGLVHPGPAQTVPGLDMQHQLLSIRRYDFPCDQYFAGTAVLRHHPHGAPIAGLLQGVLQVYRHVAGFSLANLRINAPGFVFMLRQRRRPDYLDPHIQQLGFRQKIIRHGEGFPRPLVGSGFERSTPAQQQAGHKQDQNQADYAYAHEFNSSP